MQTNIILNKLKTKLSEFEYESYISLMVYDEQASRSDTEVFYVPNIFVANWIKSNYLELISNLFEEANANGVRPEIHILVKEKPQNVKSLKNNKTFSSFESNLHSLNPFYTFENFVVGKSNEHAHTIAQLVARQQAKAYNPVLFYGRSGLGKTHLLNAIGNTVKQQGKNVLYATSEDFLNDYLLKIKRKTMDSFREKYRKCDYLLLDDVQFFGNKEGVQEELLHTFNTLYNCGKQIVITSDKPPKAIRGLEERLRSRFEWGSIAEITSPELETKISIIKSKCEINHINLDREVIDYIASNIYGNIRQIEGILSSINAHMSLSPETNVLKIARMILKNYQNEKAENITLDIIIKTVGKELNIKPSEIVSKSRHKNVVLARRVVIYLARNSMRNPTSMFALANELNMRDHSAVSKAIKDFERQMNENPSTKNIVEDIKSRIEQKLTEDRIG